MNPLFAILEDLAAASVEELQAFIDASLEIVDQVAANPAEYAVEGRDLMAEMTSGVTAIEAARAELASRETAEEVEEVEIDTNEIAELAARARAVPEVVEPEVETAEVEAVVEATAEETEALAAEEAEETEEVEETEEEEAVTAAAEPEVVPAPAPAPRLPRPARSRVVAPPEPELVPIIAAANGQGITVGQEFGSEDEIARTMIEMRRRIGDVAEGTHGDKMPVARATWSHLYENDRVLGRDEIVNRERVEAITASSGIHAAFAERQKQGGSLVASGGLCAPVTPYYQLQMLSVADRPVRAALPAFNADRGGIRYAAPAALTSITTAVGIKTAAEDGLGGTSALKGCQVIDCPPFTETDVQILYHCLQFGNLGARTFPELVAQWNALVLAAHARMAESALLDGIGGASTAVSADNLGLGASATLPSQILAAANGMRSRHRMRSDAVLRVLLPNWVKDLLVSDVYRTQFQRFDMDAAKFVAILRAGNVEPTFHIDGESGESQVFAPQTAADLLPFPTNVVWYLYPEGSFLYLDGGVLELGLVRDSVLNSTNDFQIFGESFENVAFIGVESLKVTTPICDSGTVSLPDSVTCPIDYTVGN